MTMTSSCQSLLLLVRGMEVQGFCFSAFMGLYLVTLDQRPWQPPPQCLLIYMITVWNASVARPLLSFFDSAGVRGICILFHYVLTNFVLFCLWVFFHSLHFMFGGIFSLTTRSVLTERQLTNQGRVDVQLFPPFNLSGSPAESSVIKSILRSSILGVETSW